MDIYCAWCDTHLGATSVEASPPGRNSHGICADCSSSLLDETGTPLEEFLRGLGVPVLLVSDNVEVLHANQAALGVLGKSADAVTGRLGGEVFECANADLPGGCGRTIHCSACVLRHTVETTYQEGTPQVRVPASLQARAGDGPGSIDLLITTARVGGHVLLKVEPAP